MSEFTRGFRLHQRRGTPLDGAAFPSGRVFVLDDPEWGLASSARSVEDLQRGYPDARIEWADDWQQRAEQAEAAVERARKLATQWAVLRAYGSAATELRNALGQQRPSAQQPAPASCGCGTYMRCPNGHCSRHYTCQDCGNCCSCECSGQPTAASEQQPIATGDSPC